MRWKSKTNPTPKLGDYRMQKGFLLFPKTICGETRWLEFAEWEEICEFQREFDTGGMAYSISVGDYRWVPFQWSDLPRKTNRIPELPPWEKERPKPTPAASPTKTDEINKDLRDALNAFGKLGSTQGDVPLAQPQGDPVTPGNIKENPDGSLTATVLISPEQKAAIEKGRIGMSLGYKPDGETRKAPDFIIIDDPIAHHDPSPEAQEKRRKMVNDWYEQNFKPVHGEIHPRPFQPDLISEMQEKSEFPDPPQRPTGQTKCNQDQGPRPKCETLFDLKPGAPFERYMAKAYADANRPNKQSQKIAIQGIKGTRSHAYAICDEKKMYAWTVCLGPNEIMPDQDFIDFIHEAGPDNFRIAWEHAGEFPPPGYSLFDRRKKPAGTPNEVKNGV